MKKIQFNKTFSNGKKVKGEGYAYRTANGIDVALHKEGKFWRATELTSGKLMTLNDNLTLEAVKAEAEKQSPAVLKLLRKEQNAKSYAKKKQLKAAKAVGKMSSKKTPMRPNPFQNATDIYSTKNKIAVVTVKAEKRSNVNLTTVKTKYYKRNDRNMCALRKIQTEIRRGRNGSKYDKL